MFLGPVSGGPSRVSLSALHLGKLARNIIQILRSVRLSCGRDCLSWQTRLNKGVIECCGKFLLHRPYEEEVARRAGVPGMVDIEVAPTRI